MRLGSSAALALAVGAVLLTPAVAHADGTGLDTTVRGQQGYVLRVTKAERPSSGVVRLTVELAARGDQGSTLSALNGKAPWASPGAGGFVGVRIAASGTGTVGTPIMQGAQCTCTRISAPPPGQAVLATVDLADPGGTSIDVYPAAAQPVFAVPVSGAPAPGQQLDQVALRSREALTRTRTAAATVSAGKKVRVDLDTSVLFALDSAQLSAQANATLDAAAKALRAQPGRRIGVYGHTDSQGTPAHNLTLSLARAKAVQAALAGRLGAGWTFDVRGYGETKPLVPEVGPVEAVKEAQAKNRRVELQVL